MGGVRKGRGVGEIGRAHERESSARRIGGVSPFPLLRILAPVMQVNA